MMSFRNRLIVGVALFSGMAFLPARAYADSIDFLGVGRNSTVSIGGVRTGTFAAGELNWQWLTATPEGFAQSFYAYCVDVTQNLRDPQTVTPRTTEGFTNGVVDGGAKAAWLVNEFAGSIHALTNVAEANTKAAALQVAIWDAMYDTTAGLVNTGSGVNNFYLTGASLTNTAVKTQAETYLSMLYGSDGSYNTSVARLVEVRSPNLGQDQIVRSVSEPSTLLLMGIATLAFVRRSRKPAA
jgi:hypothetical protein